MPPHAPDARPKPKVKFLTVVWNEVYIERFATLTLPSFLASGNLSALAAVVDLEVVIMTARRDITTIQTYAALRRLREICPVRFIEIDDLIGSAAYGVTLTLAYGRAVIACGAAMLNTHFVLMNSDFVLADGSLRSLSRHILAGRSIVLAPSLRATAEALEPTLRLAVDHTAGTLTMAPREMVRLAFANLHPTTVAKIVNQGFCHTVHPNQFFWQVDTHTMLGRYYLIFVLCLKPDRIVTAINSYCDYGFVPEMCPSGDTAVMDDSDDFLMLEVQRRDQEMFLLRLGRQRVGDVAQRVDEWATAEHRLAARHDLVFHTRDTPPAIGAAKTEARVFIEQLERRFGAPVPHAFHPYWVGGVHLWMGHPRAQRTPPPELDHVRPTAPGRWRFLKRAAGPWLRTALATWQQIVLGAGSRVTLFHPDWLDYRHLRQTADAIPRSNGTRLLVLRGESEQVDGLIDARVPARFVHPVEFLRETLGPTQERAAPYTHAFIYLLRKDCRLTRRLVERCGTLMAPGGECLVFIHHLRGELEDSNFSFELLQYLDDLLPQPLSAMEFSFVGGRLKRFNRRLLAALGRSYYHTRWPALLWILPTLALALPFIMLSNLALARRQPDSTFVQYCSSVLIYIRPPREAR